MRTDHLALFTKPHGQAELQLSQATTAKLFTPPSRPLDLNLFLAADTRAESRPQRLHGPNRLDQCDTPPDLPQRRPWGISDVHDLDYASLSLRCGLRRGPAITATPPLPQMRGFSIF